MVTTIARTRATLTWPRASVWCCLLVLLLLLLLLLVVIFVRALVESNPVAPAPDTGGASG